MPLPKSLRRPHRQPAAQTRRTPCRTCHNLDPRGNPSSVYSSESTKGAPASLSLVLDILSLAKTNDAKEGGCRFCNVLVQALDAFFDGWRTCRQRVNVDMREKGSITVCIDSLRWSHELVEIYAASGRVLILPSAHWSRHQCTARLSSTPQAPTLDSNIA